ncbi:uncharacterized protein [Physcomitrium patens]|uniref:FAM91 N-terminal domain-containing protein n=1 Tax=Physcomitrium patens TaxID=3218 RepID=A0A7I4CYX0_PHYPA|nr:protein FAM91A1-like isoform X1 [Physcomitrium patens]XP_024363377.1 protein FAM91A1-like isoform X1 [Physcomitrium patens]|eukprot:XP_024363370.1 protein FAM91A1-like isoform X1 [Physcomitrella patens]
MQHATLNTEEDMLVKAILEETPWEKLPKRLKLTLFSNEEYQKRVKEYCIKKRLKWSECAARNACRENDYYEELVRYLQKNLALFPYHLSENVCRVLRITPFRYYHGMLYDVMRNEQPYDSIPNFTAADVLRLTGIGRNEFIDIMNKCRAKKLMWKLNKSIVKEMLPTQPVDFRMEAWWIVCFVNLTTDEYRKLSEEEMAVISGGDGDSSDRLGKEGVNLVGEVDFEVLRSLYRRGLIYLDVPVYPDDHFQVSTLEGFVSNRNQQYEDPTEELLYAVFVASSEQTTVAELAQTLQANLEQLQSAVSLASRLGWAKKFLDPVSFLQDTGMPESPRSVGDDRQLSPFTSPSRLGASGPSDIDSVKSQAGLTRFAFMVDANLTSYLMMGSLSPGLKGHAVTLYEAGKLGDTSVAEMCEDLQQVEGTKMEGELQQFADHAFSLRHALECLRSQSADLEVEEEDAVDFSGFQLEPHSSVDSDDLFQSGQSFEPNTGVFEEGYSYASESGAETAETTVVMSHMVDTNAAAQLHTALSLTGRISSKENVQSYKPVSRVDVLRIESLQDLAPATMQRVLQRDYDVVVSMIPLPSPFVSSPDGLGPAHFGPPSRASISPWMKLLLYQTAGSGPVSVALIKGQRFRTLPSPLAGCAKALMWTWDGTGVNGVGGKFEGTLVEGNILLHCLNTLLKHNAVLVQPFPKTHLDSGGSGKPVTRNVPLPISESSDIRPSLIQAASELALETLGYIRLVQIPQIGESPPPHENKNSSFEWVPQSVEFGVPLFDTELCRRVCEGVIGSDLFTSKSLLKHRQGMHDLRRKLQEFIMDYRASGSKATSAYVVVGGVNADTRPLLHKGSSGLLNLNLVEEGTNNVPLPGVNLIFDGTSLEPLNVDRCLQGRLPARLVVAAIAATETLRATC